MQSFPKLQFIENSDRKEGIKEVNYPELFSSHFCWAVMGAPGCGKTTFIQNLLQQSELYKDKFDYIFIISPSNIKIDGVDQECITPQLKIDWIYERLNYLRNLDIKGANLLIIFDDCISQIKQLQNNQMLVDLFFNRRHLWKNNTISLILTTQQFTMLPLRFRSVCDHFTFLSLSPRDFDFVKKELIYSTSKKCMDQIVETFQGPKHQFIYIRLQPFLLCQNFKPLIKGSQYVSLSNEFSSVRGGNCDLKQPEHYKSKEKPQEYKGNQSIRHPQAEVHKDLFSFRK